MLTSELLTALELSSAIQGAPSPKPSGRVGKSHGVPGAQDADAALELAQLRATKQEKSLTLVASGWPSFGCDSVSGCRCSCALLSHLVCLIVSAFSMFCPGRRFLWAGEVCSVCRSWPEAYCRLYVYRRSCRKRSGCSASSCAPDGLL